MRMKIRTAIFGVYVIASAIGLAVLMAFVLWEVRLRYVESMRRTLNDTAGLLAAMLETESSASGEASDLGATWRKNLPAFEQASGMLRVYVTDAHGIVVFDANGGRDVGRDYTLRPEMIAYFSRAYGAPQNAGVVDGELRVTAPVRRNGSIVGFVGVGRSFNSVTAAVLRARVRLIAAALLIAATMVAAGWWIAQKLTHSLERLTAHAEAVRDGRPSTPPLSRAAEVSALTRAFEEMRATLEGKAHVERYTQALAHELKAPLTSIRGAAELLGEDMPAAERGRFLANLCTESERLQLIVDRLLELAALEARRDGAAHEDVELAGLIGEITEAASAAAAKKKVELRSAVEGRPRVRGDRFLLTQAISNLAQNALEFTPAGGRVVINALVHDHGVKITVEDTGPGVPDYALAKIFDRFYSLPRPDTGRKSSGLGLSIVREIARLHRGEISLENRGEGGARATLSLPVA
jgi:two-component system sensor histidine kinase CreC